MSPFASPGHDAVNWRGVWTLYRREMTRYLRYAWETVAGPAT